MYSKIEQNSSKEREVYFAVKHKTLNSDPDTTKKNKTNKQTKLNFAFSLFLFYFYCQKKCSFLTVNITISNDTALAPKDLPAISSTNVVSDLKYFKLPMY
jgi:hypothetical protein